MKITIGYLHEKFQVAVDTLVGDGPLRERLRNVAMFVDLIKVEEFPIDELRERFRTLLEELTRIDAMTDDERRGVAIEVFSLFREIADLQAWERFEFEWLQGRRGGPA